MTTDQGTKGPRDQGSEDGRRKAESKKLKAESRNNESNVSTKPPGTRCRQEAGSLCFWITRTFQYPYCRYWRKRVENEPRG